MNVRKLKFIDLYAGLGGFHLGLSELGMNCVFASEIDQSLRENYQQNFGLECAGDIFEIQPSSIPDHDILCAGFPCQPFSKAGPQRGLEDEKNGKHIDVITSVLLSKKPNYFLLENVPNLLRQNNSATWRMVMKKLRSAGYDITSKVLSSEKYGSPQKRERLYIFGSKSDLLTFEWPEESNSKTYVRDIIEERPNSFRSLSQSQNDALDVWQEFMDLFPKDLKKPSFPIWSQEFGSNYPIHGRSPKYAFLDGDLSGHLGSFGIRIPKTKSWEEAKEYLPPYARGDEAEMPDWKVKFLEQNRGLYAKLEDRLKNWLPKLKQFHHSYQKFEWNFFDQSRSLEKTIIQFRGSGIRAKSDDFAPTLVSLNKTQVPVIGKYRRFMTLSECARLQGLEKVLEEDTFKGNVSSALGNAVNVMVVKALGRSILEYDTNLSQSLSMVAE